VKWITFGPFKFALHTSLSKFMAVPLKFPSINQSNDRRRASGRISQLRTTKKPTPAMLSTTTRSSYSQYPLLTPFPAHPIFPCNCISVSTHRWASTQSRLNSRPDRHLSRYNGFRPRLFLRGFAPPTSLVSEIWRHTFHNSALPRISRKALELKSHCQRRRSVMCCC
jgi:hypothetical protein